MKNNIKFYIPSIYIYIFFLFLLLPLFSISSDIYDTILSGSKLSFKNFITSKDDVSYLLENKEIYQTNIISQIIFYFIYKHFSFIGLNIFYTFIWLLAFFIPSFYVIRKLKSDEILPHFVGLIISILISLNNSDCRTQGLMFLCLPIFIILIKNLTYKRLFPLFLLMIFWQNTHQSLSIGVTLIGIFTLLEFIKLITKKKNKFLVYFFASILSLISFFLTPATYHILEINYSNMLIAKATSLSEWCSIFKHQENIQDFFRYFCILFMGYTLFKIKKSKFDFKDIVIILYFMILACLYIRFIILFAIIMIFYSHKIFDNLPRLVFNKNESKAFKILLTIFIIFFIFTRVTAFKSNYQKFDLKISSLTDTINLILATFKNESTIHIFSEYPETDLLVLKSNNKIKVHLDSRLYLYSLKNINEYTSILNGKRLQKLINKYDIKAFVLPKNETKLSNKLDKNKNFKPIKTDINNLLYIKNN